MAPFGAAAGISASLRLRLRYAPIPANLRTPLPGTQTTSTNSNPANIRRTNLLSETRCCTSATNRRYQRKQSTTVEVGL